MRATPGLAPERRLRRENWWQLARFCLVGASGVLVNMATLVVAKQLAPPHELVFWDLPLTDYNVRWYHVLSTIAFVVANLWNFELNRRWTFPGAGRWWRAYPSFLVVGLAAQLVGLLLLTLLMHPRSPVALPAALLDDSTPLRTRLYWAQLIVIVLVTPLSFVLNKTWTFRAVRRRNLA